MLYRIMLLVCSADIVCHYNLLLHFLVLLDFHTFHVHICECASHDYHDFREVIHVNACHLLC